MLGLARGPLLDLPHLAQVKHGYPLETSGQGDRAADDHRDGERIKLLSGENAQLRAELGAVRTGFANVERIVTDDSHRPDQEIEALRLTRN